MSRHPSGNDSGSRENSSGIRWTAGTLAFLSLCLAVCPTTSAQEPSGIQVLSAAEEVFVDVIARTERSVVSIGCKRNPKKDDAAFSRPIDPFNRFRPSVDDSDSDVDFTPHKFGAGVVIDSRGLILTNYHVLDSDSQYFVTTIERKQYEARIKAADPRSDLAVLEIIDAEKLSLLPIKFGDAASLRKGQLVLTLGNPYAIARDGQVSAGWGMISNLGRKAAPEPPDENSTSGSKKPTLHHYGTLIQTDAKLNLGTSGGPLLNLKGEMVGLITSQAALAGYEHAAGYAIPVDDTFRRVVDRLKQGKEVEYGFLGIGPRDFSRKERIAGKQGMRVERIVSGTPADTYNLRMYDEVVAINGQQIHDVDGLMLQVGKLPADAPARLTVNRNGQILQIDVERLAKFCVQGSKVVTAPEPDWRGMRVEYATALKPEFLLFKESLLSEGLVAVAEVTEGSPAWAAGIRPEMVISHVGGGRVHTPAEFRAAVASKSGPVELVIAYRNNEHNQRKSLRVGTASE